MTTSVAHPYLSRDEQARAAQRMLHLVRVNLQTVPGPNTYDNRFRPLTAYLVDMREGRKNLQDFFEILLDRAPNADMRATIRTMIERDTQLDSIYRAHLVLPAEFRARGLAFARRLLGEDDNELSRKLAACLDQDSPLGTTLARCRIILANHDWPPRSLETYLQEFYGLPIHFLGESADRFAP